MPPEDNRHLDEHFARVRRTKRFLRFMPRRAMFHKYPLIGRFADLARQRSYLWSFKTTEVRPALYLGSLLAFMPMMGVQLPAAFLLALVLRANVMILGGLQFITNPVTAGVIYVGTYQLGRAVIDASGFGQSMEVHDPETLYFAPDGESFDLLEDAGPADPAQEEAPTEIRWSRRMGTAINTLVLGGALAGLFLGAVLDVLWRLGVRRTEVHRRKIKLRGHRHRSDSTPPATAPK